MTDYGEVPDGGWSPLVSELLVTALAPSVDFWCGLLGFEIAYQRPEENFVYLQRDGAQVMLHQRADVWETGTLEVPFGRGVMFQLEVDDVGLLAERFEEAGVALYAGPREVWRRTGGVESGQREIFVQDPDGYLLMLAQVLGTRDG